MILFVTFLHFFPQYAIRTRWDSTLLQVKVRDTLNTIDRLNKTYDFATVSTKFEEFMNSTFYPEQTGGVVVWWKDVKGDIDIDEPVPYFTRGYKESIVDVINVTDGCTDGNCYKVYSFTLGMGYPF